MQWNYFPCYTVFSCASTECLKNLHHTLTLEIFHLVKLMMNHSGAKFNTFNIKFSLKELLKEYFTRNAKKTKTIVKKTFFFFNSWQGRWYEFMLVRLYARTSVSSFFRSCSFDKVRYIFLDAMFSCANPIPEKILLHKL